VDELIAGASSRQTAVVDDAEPLPQELAPMTDLASRRAFVQRYTALQRPPSVGEVQLWLADEVTRIWEMTEQEMQQVGLDPPFWAFAWAGGQALARYLLDHPDAVAGRSVLDLGAGSGLVAVAARLAGARSALAVDIDPFCAAAIELNAEANGVEVAHTDRDLLADDVGVLRVDADLVGVDLILAGDVSYEFGMSGRMHRWLRAADAAGVPVMLGDPGRRYLPSDGLEQVAAYDIVTTPDLEESDLRRAAVYRYARSG
jgi:predicted nicotinamide N-methyase